MTMQSRRISRRTVVTGSTATAIGALASWSKVRAASTSMPRVNINRNQGNGEISIYSWYQNWVEEVTPEFEDETGIKVNAIGTYSSNDEWWARLNAGEKFDFFMPTSDWVERAIKADLLLPLDVAKIPNIEHLEEDYQSAEMYQADGNTYATPFTRLWYSLTYNTDTFPEAPTSWDVTWDEQYKSKITVQDNALARVGGTAIYLGDDPFNPTKWDEIRDALIEQKQLISKYWKDYQAGMEMFAGGEVVVGQLTDGRTRMAMTNGAPLNWTVPEEGALVEIDTFAIPKHAENPEGALAFMDFLYRPEVMVRLMEGMGYDTMNAGAHELLAPALVEGFASPDGAQAFITRDLPPDIRTQIEETWTEVQLT